MPPPGRRPRQHERFSGLAGDADEVLGEGPLSQAQVEPFRAWASEALKDASSVEQFVEEHPVNVNAARWHGFLDASPRLMTVIDERGAIRRRDVVEVAHESARSRRWIPLLHASFAWGQGKNGYGPARLTQIHDAAARADVNIEDALREAVAAMEAGTAVDGYKRLRKRVPWLGPAFYTKFLYFAGAASPPAAGPSPLILDAVVASQVRAVVAARYAARHSDSRHVSDAEPLATWLWSSGGWSPHRYGVWLSFANAATAQLRSEIPVWSSKADAFELAVFDKQLRP